MDSLKIFKNEQFGQVRTLDIDGKTYFVAVDIARPLGYTNTTKAINDHCKGVTKRYIPTNGGNQEMLVIPEGDIYRLAARSQLPLAEKFEEWIFDEVLPSIRQNGGYLANQESLTPEQIVAQALIVANNIIQEKDKLLQEQKPKVEFFDTVANSKTALPMDKVAKVLDMGIGRNKLFELLREKKILDRSNIPYQTYVDRGYFRVVEQKYTKPSGETVVTTKTLVYQRGVDYIRKLVSA